MKDAIAYMAWERVVPWKILSLLAYPDKPLKPIGFGARHRSFYDSLEPGSRIWVVTRISNEFSLAGVVTVKEVLNREEIPRKDWPHDLKELMSQWRYVARADPDHSEFYETNSAEPILDKLGIRFAQNRTIVYHDASVGELFKPCMDQARNTIFLSYRWKESRRFAIALARELRKRGWSPWLDALSIPKYKTSREPGVNLPRLQKLLELGIAKSKLAVVINSRTFIKSKWTMFELEHIRKYQIPGFQVMCGGKALRGAGDPIFKTKPVDVAEEILASRLAQSLVPHPGS